MPAFLALAPWTATAVMGVTIAMIFAARAARAQWRPALQLFELALAVRLMVLMICFAVRSSAGVETVNPDVAGYLSWGREIARYLPAFFDIRPIFLAATNDIGFHYILGLEIWIFGDDPLTLLSVNAAAGAAAVVAIYLLLRLGGGKLAFPLACVAAFYPGLVFISSGDLFKDPWVLLAMFGGLALAFRAAQKRSAAISWSLAAGFLFFILQITRFYTLPLSLLCLAAGAIADRWHATTSLRCWIRRWAIVATGVAIGIAGPAYLVRQPSVLDESLSYTQVFRGPSQAFLAAEGRIVGRLGEETAGMLGVGSHGAVRIAADLVRRFYGPYLWVPSAGGSNSVIEGGFWEYLSTPFWYVLLPLGLLSFLALPGRRPEPIPIAAAVGTAATLLLLAVFSISYRQRSSLAVPFLLLLVGFSWTKLRRPAVKRALWVQAGIVLALAVFYYLVLLA